MRWTDPSTWPLPVWIWVAFLVGGWALSLWRWRKKRVEAEWPATIGRIETASVDSSEKKILGLTLTGTQNDFPAVVTYSYSVGGGSYGGSYKRTFGSRDDAEEFIRDLEGRPIEVQYQPTRHETSALTDAAIDAVLGTRPPEPGAPAAESVAGYLKPFLWLLIALALFGFGLSLLVHIGSFSGRVPPMGEFIGLHVGIFVVWFPAVVISIRLAKGGRGKDLWKRVLRGAPDWTRYTVYAVFTYCWISGFFSFGMAHDRPKTSGGGLDPAMIRGFSSTWMAFYSIGAAILYSAVRLAPTTDRCLNGHAVAPNARFCPTCGQPVSHAPLQSPPQ